MTSDLFPITVVTAIFLFFVKELFELYRRVMNDRRKLSAIKNLLAVEIEKNSWTLKNLKTQLEEIKNNPDSSIFEVVLGKNELPRFVYKRNDGRGGSSPIFKVSSTIFDKVIIELAVLAPKVFELAEQAYEGVAEVQHIRTSLIENLTNKEQETPEEFIASFAEYGIEVLNS